MTPGSSIRQGLQLTANSKMTYTISSSVTSTSFINSKNTSTTDNVNFVLLDPEGKLIQGISIPPGLEEPFEYTPSSSGVYNIIMQTKGNVNINSKISGGTRQNDLNSEKSLSKLIEGKRKYYIYGLILQDYIMMVDVREVTSISSDGKATMSNVTGATVTMGASGKTYNLTYSTSHNLGFMTYSGYYAQIPSGDRSAVSSNSVSLAVSHPTITDLSLSLSLNQYPNYVSNIKIEGNSTLNGASSLTVSPNSDLTITWDNASTTNKPDLVKIDVISSSNGQTSSHSLYPRADQQTYKIKKELLKILTSTSLTNTDNCIGINGGAGESYRIAKDYFVGYDSTNTLVRSGLSIAKTNTTVNFPTTSFPAYGYACETNVVNPLVMTSVRKFSQDNVPILVVQ
jgi:hypothetical protein